MLELSADVLDQVHGGAKKNGASREQLLLQLRETTDAIRAQQSGLLPLGDFSTVRSHGYYDPPGANHRVEYPGGFKPNGDAVSWRTRNKATGQIISSGTNP